MKIELIPAIDLINGQCVRLTKGDYDQKKVYNDNPAEVAKHFEQLGFKRLHVVDLDGAKSKHIVNDAVLKAITTETHLVVDFGGGIKTEEDIEKAFAAGASMVTVGSIAVTHPELFLQWLDKYGADKLILGADVRNGRSKLFLVHSTITDNHHLIEHIRALLHGDIHLSAVLHRLNDSLKTYV